MTGSYERILHEMDGAVAILTLNRPEKRNALDKQTLQELTDALGRAAGDERVRVVLLRAAGPDFCAGADLAQLQRIARGADAVENLHDATALGDLFVRMRRHPSPIVAAVQGNAIAGGAGLATACDLVLAAEDASFGYPEIGLGFVPAMVMALLRRSVGEKTAFELVALGGRFSAEAARQVGLVNRTFPPASLDEAALTFSRDLAQRSASALELIKRLLYGMDGMAFEAAIARGAEVNALARATDDCRAGVTAFLGGSAD